MGRLIIYCALLGTALGITFCNRETNTASPFLNLDPEVTYVGMATCRSCHNNVHSTFVHTGMGRSFDAATPQKSAASFGPHDVVYDKQNDLYYKPFFKDSVMYVLEYRLVGGDTVHQRLEKISYIVGSGQHTNSHIIAENGYVYQAPVTYYTQQKKWDLAPGFDEFNERFDRFLTTECITCHNHYPEHVAGSLNKYAKMPAGIECERCHGPGSLHVKEKLAGHLVDTATQTDFTIVNPRKLPRDLQMDLCQRCHLQGVSILEEGKSYFDFRPGMPLNSVMNVFLPRFTNSHEKFIMASQADRLRLSNCYKMSEMTCLSCHNPHVSVEATGKDHYNAACQSCHAAPQKTCSAPAAERNAAADNCSGCHMPRSGSTDIPHVNITDHWISKTNIKGKKTATTTQADFLGLQILTKTQASPLDMARGYIATFDKYLPSAIMLDSARYYLERSRLPAKKTFDTWIHLHFARRDYAAIAALAATQKVQELSDGWTAYRIGEALYSTQSPTAAMPYYQRAAELMPYTLEFKEKLGTAQLALRSYKAAIATFEAVLKENPKRKLALSNLGFAWVLQGRYAQGEAYYAQALALDPDYLQALLNKAAVRLLQGDKAEARKLLQRALKIDPQNAQALEGMRRVEG